MVTDDGPRPWSETVDDHGTVQDHGQKPWCHLTSMADYLVVHGHMTLVNHDNSWSLTEFCCCGHDYDGAMLGVSDFETVTAAHKSI